MTQFEPHTEALFRSTRIRMPYGRTVAVVAALVLVAAAAQSAQAQQGDVRLSWESQLAPVPQQQRIQAAATIGSKTLVAWGSGRLDVQGKRVAYIGVHLYDAWTPDPEPRIVSTDSAVPSDYLAVVPTGTTFVLFWYDLRPARPGLYRLRIDTSGTMLDSEMWIGRQQPSANAGLQLFGTADQILLVWRDTTPSTRGTYVQAMSRDGTSFGGALLTSGNPAAPVFRLPGEGGAIAIRDSVYTTFIRPDGQIADHSIASSMFGSTWHIAEDSLVVSYAASKLSIYSGFHGQGPVRRIDVSAMPAIKDSVVSLGRDSARNIVMVYPNPGKSVGGSLEWYVVRRVFSPTGEQLRYDTLVWYYDGPAPAPSGSTGPAFRGIRSWSGCNNSRLVSIDYVRIFYPTRGISNVPDVPMAWRFSVNSRGEFMSSTSLFDTSCCVVAPGTRIEQVTRNTDSVMHRAVITSLPKLPWFWLPYQADTVPVPQRWPSLTVKDGRILVGWMQNNDPVSVLFCRWEPSGSMAATLLSAVRSHEQQPYRRSSLGALVIENQITSTFDGYPPAHWNYWNSLCVLRQTSTSLSSVKEVVGTGASEIGSGGSSDLIGERAHAADPVRDEILLYMVGYFPEDNYNLVLGISANSERVWKYGMERYFTPAASLIPIELHRLLIVDGDTLFRVDSGRVIRRSTHPGRWPKGTQFLRLLDSAFVSMTHDTARALLTVERCSFGGATQKIAWIQLGGKRRFGSVIESRTDSSIAVVWGSNEGVRLTYLDKKLRTLVVDSLVSATRDSVANPTAYFRNDSLFLAWEDYRNGNPDIYGTSIVLPAVKEPVMPPVPPPTPPPVPVPPVSPPADSASGSSSSGTRITSIFPNPAGRNATLNINLPPGKPGILRILDVSGREVGRRAIAAATSGIVDVELELSGLANGHYLAVMKSGAAVDTRGFVVMVR